MLVSGSSSSSPHFLPVVSATCEVKLINTISLIKATATRQVKIETSKIKKTHAHGAKKEKVAITVNEFNAKGARQTHLPLSLPLALDSFSKLGYSLDVCSTFFLMSSTRCRVRTSAQENKMKKLRLVYFHFLFTLDFILTASKDAHKERNKFQLKVVH